MPEGLDVQPGHTLGCLCPSAAPNVSLVVLQLEEGASGAQLCRAAPMDVHDMSSKCGVAACNILVWFGCQNWRQTSWGRPSEPESVFKFDEP